MCRNCFLSSGKGFKPETYTSPSALQALLRIFGFSIADNLAKQSLFALEQAVDRLYRHLQNHKESLTLLLHHIKVSASPLLLHLIAIKKQLALPYGPEYGQYNCKSLLKLNLHVSLLQDIRLYLRWWAFQELTG